MAAISMARPAWWPGSSRIAALKRLGVRPACDVAVMGIRAEESVWFQVSYIGSRGALGTLPDGALDGAADRYRADAGRAHARMRRRSGCAGAAARGISIPARLRAYLELHIEQAPSLVEAGSPVGICTGIPGNFRYPDACIEGSDDHVGLPRRFRHDAAMAGAEFAMAMDRLWEDARGARHADGLHHRPVPHRPGAARADHRARDVPFQPGRARL